MVKSACGIKVVHMCVNKTGIRGGETKSVKLVSISIRKL